MPVTSGVFIRISHSTLHRHLLNKVAEYEIKYKEELDAPDEDVAQNYFGKSAAELTQEERLSIPNILNTFYILRQFRTMAKHLDSNTEEFLLTFAEIDEYELLDTLDPQ